MDKPIFIILPVHNRSSVTLGFIESLVAQTDQNYRLLLVDDGCTDDTVEMVSARVPQVIVLPGDGNLWWAASVQKGIDWLSGHAVSGQTIVLVANDDTTFGPAMLASARAYLAPRHGVMAQAVPVDPETALAVDHGTTIDWKGFRMFPAAKDGKVDCLASRCLFFHLGDALRVGGFRRRFLPHYLSDYEFTMRAKRRGIALAAPDEIRIFLSRETTGVRSATDVPLLGYARLAFSKRYSYNPFYFSVFVLLAAPVRHVPMSLARIWGGFIAQLLRSARVSLSRSGNGAAGRQ